MKKYLFIVFLAVLGACDDYEDPFTSENKTPEILVKSNQGTEFVNEFTDSLKFINQSYQFQVQIKDEENSLIPSVVCDDETASVKVENNTVNYIPTQLGENTITISTSDGFGVESKARVNIVTFDNLAPVAKFRLTVDDKAQLDPLERIIDASISFDRDERFGGKIIKYEFRVENEAFIQKTENFRKYIFPQEGSYTIYVRVQDSDGVWSETTSERFVIN